MNFIQIYAFVMRRQRAVLDTSSKKHGGNEHAEIHGGDRRGQCGVWGVDCRASKYRLYDRPTSTTPEVPGELSPLSDTISGTITTDGTLGVLRSSDILSYNLQINDKLRPAYDVDLTPANSGILADSGNGLTASATGLSFDFSDAGAVFTIQGTTDGFYSGYQYLCVQATSGPCAAGETIVPDYCDVDGVVATGLSGTLPLSGVPEPATWAMLLLGVGGLGAVTRSRRRMVTMHA